MKKLNTSLVEIANHVFAKKPWQRYLPLGFLFSLPQFLRAENQVAYRYEFYSEDKNRMEIETHSVYFEQKLLDLVTAKGELIYDGISGATPIGTHNGKGKAKLTKVTDLRRAGNIGLEWRFGDHTLSTGFSFSKEHDYLSYGLSVSDAITFNEKNTILKYGVSHNFDSVRHNDGHTWTSKDSTEVMIGLSQLLSPKDIYDVAFTYGHDSGYLTDPYRLAEYLPDGFPVNHPQGIPERRPSHRNKEILFNAWTHHFNSLNASLESSYRFYHDSYDIFSHTLGLTWHQRLGERLIIEPLFRFSEQSAASFYSTQFSGPFIFNPAGPDGLHSSDYRLSEFYSLDFGLQVTAILNSHLRVNAGYHRYGMYGLDKTTSDMYPQANVFTVGLQILW